MPSVPWYHVSNTRWPAKVGLRATAGGGTGGRSENGSSVLPKAIVGAAGELPVRIDSNDGVDWLANQAVFTSNDSTSVTRMSSPVSNMFPAGFSRCEYAKYGMRTGSATGVMPGFAKAHG